MLEGGGGGGGGVECNYLNAWTVMHRLEVCVLIWS